MIPNLFLLFVAAGILMASMAYGFGGLFPILGGLCVLTILFKIAFGRRAPGLNSVRFDLSRYEPLYDQRSSPEDQDEDFAGGDDARGKF